MPNQYFYGFQWSLEFQEISILYWNYKGICDLGVAGILLDVMKIFVSEMHSALYLALHGAAM